MRPLETWSSLFLLLIGALWTQSPLPQTQAGAEEARGAFLVTRKNPVSPKPTPTPQKLGSFANRSKIAPKKPSSPDVAKTTSAETKVADRTASAQPVTPEPSAMGLGYTLFQRNAAGEAVRVSASQPFYEDDQVRFVIEPNTDGYLYIFYTENDGEPEMIFPDHRLAQGANQVKAHVPYEAPSRNAPIKWFTFTENKPASLRLFIVVSRQPLPNVPMGQELVDYCKPYGAECVWKPSREYFDPVLVAAGERKLTHKREATKQVLASLENEAITRGIKLKAEAPEPDIIYLNASATTEILVVSAVLNQRPRP